MGMSTGCFSCCKATCSSSCGRQFEIGQSKSGFPGRSIQDGPKGGAAIKAVSKEQRTWPDISGARMAESRIL